MGCNGLGCLNLRVITFHCSYPNPSKREGWRSKKSSRERSLCPSLMLFHAGQALIRGMRNMRSRQAARRIQESQFCDSWGDLPPLSYEIRSRNPSPLPLGLLPYPGLEGSEDSRASFYLRGVDFLGVSEQEGDEGCDLSVSSATPFWSPVNFRSMSPASLGLGWAWVLVEGPTQLLWERKRQEGSYPPDQNRAPLECLHHQPSAPLPACCLF